MNTEESGYHSAMTGVRLDEITTDDLARVSALIRGDAEGMAEFGGFYADAPTRLGPLLNPRERRVFAIVVADVPVGFLDADVTTTASACRTSCENRSAGRDTPAPRYASSRASTPFRTCPSWSPESNRGTRPAA